MCPAVKTASFIREGLNVQEGPYCYGLPAWGYLVVGCFRSKDDLGTIPNPKLFVCSSVPPCFYVSLDLCTSTFEQVYSRELKREES